MADSDATMCAKCGKTLGPQTSSWLVQGKVEHLICPPPPASCAGCREPILPIQKAKTVLGQDYHWDCYDRESRGPAKE